MSTKVIPSLTITTSPLTRLAGLALTVLGAWLLMHVMNLVVTQATRLNTYLPVPATITMSQVISDQPRIRGSLCTANIIYAYTVAGHDYSCRTVSPVPYFSSHMRAAAAQLLVNRFQSGASVTAYYAPDHPGDAFLLHEPGFGPYKLVLIVMLPLVIGLSLQTSNGSTHRTAAQHMLGLALLWAAAGVAVFGHYLWMRGHWGWQPCIVLVIYALIVLLLARSALKHWRIAASLAASGPNQTRIRSSRRTG